MYMYAYIHYIYTCTECEIEFRNYFNLTSSSVCGMHALVTGLKEPLVKPVPE